MSMAPTCRPEPKNRPADEPSASVDRWNALATLSVAICAVLGLAFAFVMPPLQLNDEHGHFIRAYQISRGAWIGHSAPALPPPIVTFLQRYPEAVDRQRKIAPSEVVADLLGRVGTPSSSPSDLTDNSKHKYLTWSILGSNLYCPLVYLPSSVGIGIARALHFSPLGMFYSARVFNVLVLALALWLAFRLVPASRALMAAIALMPMTLHQAGGVSADLVTIAVSMVGFAVVLRVRCQAVGRRFLTIVLVVFTLWALCKTSIWALPLILLIPSAAFKNAPRRVVFMAGVGVAMLAALSLWQIATYDNMQIFHAARLARGIDTSANLAVIAAHPLHFARMLVAFIGVHAKGYIGQFIGAFGWTKLTLSVWTSTFYFGLILFVALFEPPGRPISLAERGILVSVFIGAVLAIHAILFVSDGVVVSGIPPSDLISFPYSAGIQGRYFIPFCFAGFLALRQNRFTINSHLLLAVVLYTATVYDLLSLCAIFRNYYL